MKALVMVLAVSLLMALADVAKSSEPSTPKENVIEQ